MGWGRHAGVIVRRDRRSRSGPPAEAAAVLGVSNATLRRWLRNGVPPRTRLDVRSNGRDAAIKHLEQTCETSAIELVALEKRLLRLPPGHPDRQRGEREWRSMLHDYELLCKLLARLRTPIHRAPGS